MISAKLVPKIKGSNRPVIRSNMNEMDEHLDLLYWLPISSKID
jgi:hypothetical protein